MNKKHIEIAIKIVKLILILTAVACLAYGLVYAIKNRKNGISFKVNLFVGTLKAFLTGVDSIKDMFLLLVSKFREVV